ncbi:hypothetical protein BS47DRAFT_1195272 [Hydnum rufescens UP504]|uniref:Uncharacterized protein n=1 Tax=Hydnum rufescens UP504 TaxID=1448309 RepID=A0A9P6DUZ1_9AGAM|nr:hypothetical protein BS47DRAFT_1195272 [Hydnum rufescens UP504]
MHVLKLGTVEMSLQHGSLNISLILACGLDKYGASMHFPNSPPSAHTLYTITHLSICSPAFSAIVRTNHLACTVFHL